MTSHPSPDGISERVANLQTLLEVKRDANTRRRVHQMHSASWKALTAIRDEAYRNIADEMTDDDFVAALCTLVRGASEDRARLDWLNAQIGQDAGLIMQAWTHDGRRFIPKDRDGWPCLMVHKFAARGGTDEHLRDAVDAARTPNQDSPNGR